MARKYPRLGSWYVFRGERPCAICKQPGADAVMPVQVNWFRGDDDVHIVHKECIKGKKDEQILRELGY